VNTPVAIVLAAGQGRRMKSDLPKVLHDVCGRPMIEYVLDAVRSTGCQRIIVVVGHMADAVKSALSEHDDVEFALQAEQKGTGHAVMMCAEALADHDGPAVILAGDTPLLRPESLAKLLTEQQTRQAACVVGTAETDENEGLGRIVRNENGQFVRIVEQRDATPEQTRIREINTGCFVFDCRALLQSLELIRPENSQAEYYLTDCPEILLGRGQRVIAHCALEVSEAMGINTSEQLAAVSRLMQSRN